jgi:hypothetical protein
VSDRRTELLKGKQSMFCAPKTAAWLAPFALALDGCFVGPRTIACLQASPFERLCVALRQAPGRFVL